MRSSVLRAERAAKINQLQDWPLSTNAPAKSPVEGKGTKGVLRGKIKDTSILRRKRNKAQTRTVYHHQVEDSTFHLQGHGRSNRKKALARKPVLEMRRKEKIKKRHCNLP